MNEHKLSEDFLNKIAGYCAGYVPRDIIEGFIKLAEKEVKNFYFTWSSESNMLRIFSSMYDKNAFVADAVRYPHYIEILIAIAVNSNYLTDILVRNPEYFYRMVNPSHLNKTLSYEDCRELAGATVQSYRTFPAKVNALRSLKRREILRIGLRDISGNAGLAETTLQLSILAKEISSLLFTICFEEILARNKIPKVNNRYCIISLGKLGGKELNFSSDIDLIAFFDKDTAYNKKSFQEILTEAIFLFIEQSSSVTGNGYLYRVDFRLRPDGRNAPLCGSINDYLNYYESRGEDWERQMLIKADYLTGDRELYNRFMTYLQPFVFPSSFKSSPAEQIKKLKINIELSLKDEHNIKLSEGGIRDIEFTIQALQLLNGHKDKSLRNGNTLQAIEALAAGSLISSTEQQELTSSYILYRRIEHYLQLMNDRQTHSIPAEGEMLIRLAAFLKYKSEKEFLADISSRKKKIRQIFNSLSSETKKPAAVSEGIKFANPAKAEKDLNYLREGKGLLGNREFDLQSINAFAEIEPYFLKYLSASDNPDNVLRNFVRIVRISPFPSLWYSSFRNAQLFDAFLTICEYSQRSVDLFAEDEVLQEMFLSGEVFKRREDYNSLNTRQVHFILAAQLCLNLITPDELSKILSSYFKARIRETAAEYLNEYCYLIAGAGSFAAGNMTFASDIDLIFITDEKHRKGDYQKVFQKFLLKMKEDFKPFDTDCRLRPEGKTSQLVWDIDSYKNYLQTRARVWEFQSLSRLVYIAGEKKIFNRLIKAIDNKVKELDCTTVKREISDMRKKLHPADYSGIAKVFNLKKSSGGLTDIEFIIQYLILCTPELFSGCRGKNIPEALKLLKDKLSPADRDILLKGYYFLHSADLMNQNMFNINNHNIDPQVNLPLSGKAGMFSTELKTITASVNQVYKKIIGSK